MNRKRIRQDYVNVDYVDAKGRVRTAVNYRGATYMPEAATISAIRVCYAALALLSLALFVVPLCFNLAVFRTVYFTMPYVLQVFVVFVWGYGAYHILFSRPPYKEETYHRLSEHPRYAALAALILSLACVVSFAVYASKGAQGADYIALGCTLGTLIASLLWLLLLRRLSFAITPAPQEPADVEDKEATESCKPDLPQENVEASSEGDPNAGDDAPSI